MLKKHQNTVCHLILILLLVVLFIVVWQNGNQEALPIAMPNTFRGEYSLDGEVWQGLESDTEISALSGDLFLRGHFLHDIPQGHKLYFYLNHLTYEITVNSETAGLLSFEDYKLTHGMCAEKWHYFTTNGINTDDVVEIHLSNPHHFGNTSAYSEFLDSFYFGPDDMSSNSLGNVFAYKTVLARSVGLFILFLSIGIMGVALAFSMMSLSLTKQLSVLALCSFGVGGYIAFDTIDISLLIDSYALNTYGKYLCMMLAALEFKIFISVYLSTKVKKTAQIVTGVEGAMIAVIAVLCMTDRVLIFDTMLYWCIAQLVICPVLLACCINECSKTNKHIPVMLISCILLLSVMILDIFNTVLMWWPTGLVTKIVFSVLFVFHLVRAIKHVPESYKKASETDKLMDDLRNSNIIMAMSQIRTHFIFNILNAISGMCKYDPEKADRTVVRFARYMRANIDIMQDDQLISFRSELQHLEDYVALEQVRFGDKVRFVTDIKMGHFMLPPMILQPVVENAIKHGLTPKLYGGTVTLRTWLEDNNICISISDDGIGFDVSTVDLDKYIGLKNVRFRLKHIMNGDLDIKSEIGYGTTVTVTFPREEGERCM